MLEDLRDYGLIWQRKAKRLSCVIFCGADADPPRHRPVVSVQHALLRR